MENFNSIVELIFPKYRLAILIVFVPAFAVWLFFVPWKYGFYSPFIHVGYGSSSFGNLLVSFILFLSSVALLGFSRKLFVKPWYRLFLLVLTNCAVVSNFSFIASYFPKVEDIGKYEGTIYVLTESQFFTESSPYEEVVLTKFKWGAVPVSVGLGQTHYDLKLVFDKKMHLVSLARESILDYDPLVYTDSLPPRAFWEDAEFEGKRYYLAYVCNQDPENRYRCIYTYTVYRCELDNTSCSQLPFQYIVKNFQAEEIIVERDNKTNTINIYLEDRVSVLIFSDGDHPRCYVDGCEILPSP